MDDILGDLSSLKQRDAQLRKIDAALDPAAEALPPVRGSSSAAPAPTKPKPAKARKAKAFVM